jgi:hypothetical protein
VLLAGISSPVLLYPWIWTFTGVTVDACPMFDTSASRIKFQDYRKLDSRQKHAGMTVWCLSGNDGVVLERE